MTTHVPESFGRQMAYFFWHGDDDKPRWSTTLAPIVAWKMAPDGDCDYECAIPVMPYETAAINRGARYEGIVSPDESVFDVRDGETYASLLDWETHCVNQIEARGGKA